MLNKTGILWLRFPPQGCVPVPAWLSNVQCRMVNGRLDKDIIEAQIMQRIAMMLVSVGSYASSFTASGITSTAVLRQGVEVRCNPKP